MLLKKGMKVICYLIILIYRMKKEMTSKMRSFVSNTKDSKCSLIFVPFQLIVFREGTLRDTGTCQTASKFPQRPESPEAKTHARGVENSLVMRPLQRLCRQIVNKSIKAIVLPTLPFFVRFVGGFI